jgi:hypothetical protein
LLAARRGTASCGARSTPCVVKLSLQRLESRTVFFRAPRGASGKKFAAPSVTNPVPNRAKWPIFRSRQHYPFKFFRFFQFF